MKNKTQHRAIKSVQLKKWNFLSTIFFLIRNFYKLSNNYKEASLMTHISVSYVTFTLYAVVNNWIWISSLLSFKIPSISQNFTKISCDIVNMNLASFSFVRVALMRNLLSEFLTSGFYYILQILQLFGLFFYIFLQKCESSNKFKVFGGNETFSNLAVVWTSLISICASDYLIIVATIIVRYLPYKLFILTLCCL